MTHPTIPRAQWRRLVLAAALLLGTGLRIARFLENRPLWVDEAMLALNVGHRDFIALLGPLDYNQAAPGLYLWLLRVAVSVFGMHEWVLRMPSLAAGVFLPLLVWLVGRRVLSEQGALASVTMAAIARALVGYSAEAKPYELDACVTGVLLWCALWVHERDDRRRRLTLGLAGVAAIGLSMPAAFILPGIGSALILSALRRRSWAVVAAIAAWSVVWLGAFALLRYLAHSASVTAHMQTFWASVMIRIGDPEWVSRLIVSLHWGILGAMDPLDQLPPLLPAAAAVIGTLIIWKRYGSIASLLLVLPLGFALLASAFSLWPVDSRLALFLAPIGCLWMGAVADLLYFDVPHRLESKLAIMALVAVFAWPSIGRPWGPPLEASRDLIVDLSRQRAGAPVYLLPSGVPTWLYYTTDWKDPNSQRLEWYAKSPRNRNVPPRGQAIVESEASVEWRGPDGVELVGRFSGMQFQKGRGWLTAAPDANWGNAEMRRLAAAGSPIAWVYGSHTPTVLLDSLREGLRRNGGEIVDDVRGPTAAMWQVRFAPVAQGNGR
jgi:4-amino-4-deoxy-L-arabinose transferase-like glycosyltransferase